MSESPATSHFWVANPPFFASTLLVASAGDAAGGDEPRVVTRLELFDADGDKVNDVTVEFPVGEVGVIDLEPFSQALKSQGGVSHGHLAVSSPDGTRHLCRQTIGGSVALLQDPLLTKGREASFTPLIIGARREHQIVLVNASSEPAQVAIRLFYGNRAPEWNLDIPANASRLVSLESELLSSTEDVSWEKGAIQAYMRIAPRLQASVSCHVIERVPGETPELDTFRCLATW